MGRIKKNERPRTRRRRLERQARKLVRHLGPTSLDPPRPVVFLSPGEQCPICAELGEEERITVGGDKLMAWCHSILAEMKSQGYRTDMENMDDEELADHLERVLEIGARLDPPFSR